MRVILSFEGKDYPNNPNQQQSLALTSRFKVSVNGSPLTDYYFLDSQTVAIDGINIKKDKKNVIKFRPASLEEEKEVAGAVVSNIFRAIGFVLMAIFLPCAGMSFKRINKPLTKLKFMYAEDSDAVLYLNDNKYRFCIEARQADSVVTYDVAPQSDAPQQEPSVAPEALI